MKKTTRALLLGTLVLMLSIRAGAEPKKEPLLLFAAASLAEVLSELQDSFALHSAVQITTNLGSSGTLANQIVQGAAADVFISASPEWVQHLDRLKLVRKNSSARVASNELVLIVPHTSSISQLVVDSSLKLRALLGDGRLSMGDPAHVPAGTYARQALASFGWFDALRPHLLPAKDVRSALMVVEMGESPLGIVYRTDAQKSKKVRVVGAFPPSSHKPVVYSGCLCKESVIGRKYLAYISSEAADAIWRRHGFVRTR